MSDPGSGRFRAMREADWFTKVVKAIVPVLLGGSILALLGMWRAQSVMETQLAGRDEKIAEMRAQLAALPTKADMDAIDKVIANMRTDRRRDDDQDKAIDEIKTKSTKQWSRMARQARAINALEAHDRLTWTVFEDQ